MRAADTFRFLTVGTSARLVRNLWDRIAARARYPISHLVHPTYDRSSWDEKTSSNKIYFFRDDMRACMPPPDRDLLESLERKDVPTIHNMIMGDRVVSKLRYEDALAYGTFLARRLIEIYREIKPSVVIGDFDALHSSLALAVARQLNIPWFALHFTTIPSGQVAFCANLSPASTVLLEPERRQDLRGRAQEVLRNFETGKARAPAYLPPELLSPAFMFTHVPSQLRSVLQVLRRRKLRAHRKYSDYRNSYRLSSLFQEAYRLRKNLLNIGRQKDLLLTPPPDMRYAFFGLHMQPESSIDVFAYFFSNQFRIIELIARSLPPTHALLVKLHKSDVPNYSPAYLARLSQFPSVRVVAPHSDALQFIRKADLVVGIQGTIGLEAALLGKPVIMFGDSPIKVFPNVATFGKAIDLPALVRVKLAEEKPERSKIVESFANYLAPFYAASGNDWSIVPSDSEIDGYAHAFKLLERHLVEERAVDCN
ncbi:MAG TPA: hypothetical protein VK820_08675 [Steroidobacteraceae bacterium]|jgi:hypothetical protein|nr:hypothetical protein [Steroidobacteraceae bacterium]